MTVLQGVFDHRVLIGLGATRVADVTDEDGAVTGVDVQPDGLDVSGYAAALAASDRGQLMAYAQSKQQKIAAGGISVNVAASGSPQMVEASTDVESLVLLQGALAIAQSAPSTNFSWVQSTSVSVTLNATQIQTIFAAVSAFIQSTFTTLAPILSNISSGATTTTAQIDAASWPENG